MVVIEVFYKQSLLSPKRSCMPGQPSSHITPAFAFHLLAGILNNNISTTEMIRLVPKRSGKSKKKNPQKNRDKLDG